MDRLYLLAPALLGLAFLLVTFAIYCVLCWTGRTPEVSGLERRKFTELFGPFLVRYMLWLMKPVERAFVASGISPNAVTTASLASCVGCGVAIALDRPATAAWLYGLAGFTDILDGRLARATGRQSKAGALFDSVADRWGELAVFAGCAWYFRDSGWLLAVMLAVSGSLMVSYTRARGEGLGLSLDGGMMQRAERVVLVALGMMAAAWLGQDPAQATYAAPVLGGVLIVVGGLSALTALGRWREGYRLLVEREAAATATVGGPRDAAVDATPGEPAKAERPGGSQPAMRVTG